MHFYIGEPRISVGNDIRRGIMRGNVFEHRAGKAVLPAIKRMRFNKYVLNSFKNGPLLYYNNCQQKSRNYFQIYKIVQFNSDSQDIYFCI